MFSVWSPMVPGWFQDGLMLVGRLVLEWYRDGFLVSGQSWSGHSVSGWSRVGMKVVLGWLGLMVALGWF